MAKKKRNNTPRPQNVSGSQNGGNTNKSEEKNEEITIGKIKESASEAEFNEKKAQLIGSLTEEIETYEGMKKAAEEAATVAETSKVTIEAQIKEIKEEKALVENELKNINKEYESILKKVESANSDAEGIREAAETDAQGIREAAEKERIQKVSKAAKEAQKAWQDQIDDLQKQISEIAERERVLNSKKIQLDRDKADFEIQKEELTELQNHVKTLKERYSASNPSKISELELDLKEEKERYAVLLERYNAVSKKLEETQVLLDTIKTEIEGPRGGKKLISVNGILAELQELKEKYVSISEIYEKYPDDASITKLEEKANRAETLEREKDALELERNRYREEAVAARNASKELEVVKQEVEATNALNEHLLQELESHKTALESRTGDTCPSLSKVDNESESPDFVNEVNQKLQRDQIMSLKEMVSHVKNYAGSRAKKEQLFYTDNDIRSYLAGMAVSHLIILQGMSGTGKSSLPRIFSEAISGFNRLIPVESSWRDRNELLGYYNDFNKKFNAKSFTIELYRSAKERCRDIPTFIVLDEMNLARIEYYFSDFLAILQEPDHDKWLIELVSSDMRTLPMELPEDVKKKMKKEDPSIFAIWEQIEKSRQGDLKAETSDEDKEVLTTYLAKLGKLTGAKDLIDGRKIKVTDNIWFIGTANRDESTFEISDKVYDRAQVVSLNKKGKSEGKYTRTEKKFISVGDLQALFDAAISGFTKRGEVEERLEKLDEVLMDNFDISFGNRIVTQTVDFAAVFMCAGGSLTDALDYQISTKILRKVITSDDSDALIALLDSTSEYPETQRLIEKRIKDLG